MEKTIPKTRIASVIVITSNQNAENQKTQIQEALEKHTNSIKRYAFILHDKDSYTFDDVQQFKERFGVTDDSKLPKEGELKPPHFHIVLELKNALRLDLIGRWFNVNSNYVNKSVGMGAFYDNCEYLLHSNPNQKELGKYEYSTSDVVSSFEFEDEIFRLKDEKERFGRKLTEYERILAQITYEGMTLEECKELYPLEYMLHFEKFKKSRHQSVY